MIYSWKMPGQRTSFFIVDGEEVCQFEAGELNLGSKPQLITCEIARRMLTKYCRKPERKRDARRTENWLRTQIVAIEKACVITHGETVHGRDEAVIIGHKRSQLLLDDRSTGFGFSGTDLFPFGKAVAIAIDGYIQPMNAQGTLCFTAPKGRIGRGRPNYRFDGSQEDFVRVWNGIQPTRRVPEWPPLMDEKTGFDFTVR